MAYVAAFGYESVLSLEDVTAIAHEHGVPVIVDAAPALPPANSLTALPATGADLVSFSGWEDLGGPQNTGFVVGRADLVRACALNTNPNHNTVGRPFKVNAEAIVGLIVGRSRTTSPVTTRRRTRAGSRRSRIWWQARHLGRAPLVGRTAKQARDPRAVPEHRAPRRHSRAEGGG